VTGVQTCALPISIRQSYKGVYKDLIEEQQSTVRGNQRLSYDQE